MKAFKPFLLLTAALAAIVNVAPSYSQIIAIKDLEGRVFVRGLTPATPAEFTFLNVNQSRILVSNDCGAVVVRGSTAIPVANSITVNSTVVNTTTLPLGVLPPCVGGAFATPVTGNFKTANGQVVVIGNAANSAITVTQLINRVRRGTANACGISRLASSASFTVAGDFEVAGTSLNYDTIATGLPPICRGGTLYLPVVATP